MLQLVLVLVAACAPSAGPRKARLVTSCSSSAECAHDSNGCIYCFGGVCSCVLPAEPRDAEPRDAGVDSSTGTRR